MGRRSDLLEAERSYELQVREKEESGKVLKLALRFLFSQVGLLALGGFTAVVGAQMFIGLEYDYEMTLYLEKQKAANRVEAAANYLAGSFWSYAKDVDRYNFTYTTFTEKVEVDLRTFVSFIVNATEDYQYDGYVEGWDTSWTFPKALLFTITIMTTIGYGHIFPLTQAGKLFTILYALFALGIFFAILANIGSGLASGLTFMYSRFCCRCFRAERLKSEIPTRSMRKKLKRRLVDEDVGEEVFMPTSSIPIPIIVSIVIIVLYIGIGAFVFSQWEGWDLATAAYFSFITLTTIGFGDYSPQKSFIGIDDPGAGFEEYFKMGFATLYCGIGLAVIQLSISLIQEQLGRSAAIALGVKAEVIEMEVVEITPRRPDFLHEDDLPEPEKEPPAAAAAVVAVVDSEPNLPGEAVEEEEDAVEDDAEKPTEEDEEGDEDDGDEDDEDDDDGDEDDEAEDDGDEDDEDDEEEKEDEDEDEDEDDDDDKDEDD